MDTLNRFECGSVQMKCASVSRTLFSPFSLRKHIDSNSDDSGLAIVQFCGGLMKRSQFLRKATDAGHRTDLSERSAGEISDRTLLGYALSDIDTTYRSVSSRSNVSDRQRTYFSSRPRID